MTFTTSFKEEISKINDNQIEKRVLLCAYLNLTLKYDVSMNLISENASVIRKIYSDIKEIFDIRPTIKVRIQKRFRVKQIYILEIFEKIDLIKNNIKYKDILNLCPTDEEKIAFLKGAFLGVGSISDPKTSGYHLEFTSAKKRFADDIKALLKHFNIKSKIIKRNKKNIVYIKHSEDISDLIKLFKTINSLFYFEDIRIYRDHKNMVNRLNNCEIANQEKSITAGLKQMDAINYLKDNDLLDLLDEKTKIVIETREKYLDASLSELAHIISLETKYKIGKSGINHNFRKINEIINKHREVGSKNDESKTSS